MVPFLIVGVPMIHDTRRDVIVDVIVNEQTERRQTQPIQELNAEPECMLEAALSSRVSKKKS